MKHRVSERERVSYAPVLEEKTREPLIRAPFYLPFLSLKKECCEASRDGGHTGSVGTLLPVRHEHAPFNHTLFINELAYR